MKGLCAFVIVSILVPPAGSQTGSKSVPEFPRFRLVKGAVDADDLPTSGAKLCLLDRVDVCYQMPSNAGSSSGSVRYDYGLDPRAERLPLKGGGSLVFFSAQFSGGGSGTLDSLAVLRYESSGRIINLLPFVGVTNQSERAMWSIPEASSFPVLVTADFDWTTGETHFARHFYTVSAYRFDRLQDRYIKVFSYRTLKKYASLDELDQVHVLDPERGEILRRLGVSSNP